MAAIIKEITSARDLADSMPVIRDSFRTVADEFGLTPDNCPTHPSFITRDAIMKLKRPGCRFFGLFEEGLQAGFIAVEQSDGDVYYIEKLSVLPRYRHNGFGTMLVEFAFDYIKKQKGRVISIGIIDAHARVKEWYRRLGFSEVMTKQYDHLPFTVCFMEKSV